MVSDPNGYVPPEAIIGVYPVGPDGQATGEFIRNPGYGTVRDDFTRLESPDHWLGWLPGSPAAAMRGQIEEILAGQVPRLGGRVAQDRGRACLLHHGGEGGG